jgi:hypothetical protein
VSDTPDTDALIDSLTDGDWNLTDAQWVLVNRMREIERHYRKDLP